MNLRRIDDDTAAQKAKLPQPLKSHQTHLIGRAPQATYKVLPDNIEVSHTAANRWIMIDPLAMKSKKD